jgi:hypothetical protein
VWNLAPRIVPEDRRFSRVFYGRPELIDPSITSSSAMRRSTISTQVTTGTADLPSVTNDPAERRAATASDHVPVARFDLG